MVWKDKFIWGENECGEDVNLLERAVRLSGRKGEKEDKFVG